METFLIYLGKTAVSTAAFYLAFIILFKNQKHFIFNRIYLPFSFLTGFIIPLFTFTTVKYIELTNSPAAAEQIHSNLTPVISESPGFVFQWYHYLSGIYILGFIGFLLYLIYGYFKAQSIINNCEKKTLFDSDVCITKKDVHPFSFFNKIVLSERALKNPKLDMIISHEKIHVTERHTLDIIFAEILFLFQWFNPFAWLIKDAIKSNLEYKTDDVLTQQYNSEQYQLTMVGLAHKKGVAPFLNALNGSQLKNRLVMMKKKTENKYTLLKQLVVLPLLAVLVMGLANRQVKTEIIQEKTQPKIENVKKEPILIRGRVIDEYGNIVIGANVAEYDTLGRVISGTITNKNGDFVLQLRQNFEKATIRFSHTGYETKEALVDTKENKPVIIRLDRKEPAPQKQMQKQQQSEPEFIPIEKSKKRESLIIRGLDSDSTGTPIIFNKTDESNPEREPSKSIDKQNNKIEKKDSLIIRGLNSTGNETPNIFNKLDEQNSKKENINIEILIKGKVVARNTGKQIPAANILVFNNDSIQVGTVSNVNGEFAIKVNSQNIELKFTSQGYLDKEVVWHGEKELLVELDIDKKSSIPDRAAEDKIWKKMLEKAGISKYAEGKEPIVIVDGKETLYNINRRFIMPGIVKNVRFSNTTNIEIKQTDKIKNGFVEIKTNFQKSVKQDKRLYIIDGKEVFLKDQNFSVYIYPNRVSNMRQLSKERALEKYGEKAKYGAMEVTTMLGPD